MKTYLVGGSVRDELLGLEVQDRDHVVVGADAAQMLALGYRPVGADFPVFLHPETQEEYALARTERKTAPGYRGFVFHADPGVTLEEDLRRRDLTINAMARAEDGALVDPYGGERDLRARVLRHVSESFGEDPVRILRVARFAARFDEFTIAPETSELMKRMVASGEVDALVAERVWQEIARGLREKRPSRMVSVLHDCGALARILPEIDREFGSPDAVVRLRQRLDEAALQGHELAVRFALLVLDLAPPDALALALRINAPHDCRDLARLATQEKAVVRRHDLDAEAALSLIERCDSMRRPERLERLIAVVECDARCDRPPTSIDGAFLRRALDAARGVDAGAVARENPGDVPAAVRRARLAAVEALRK